MGEKEGLEYLIYREDGRDSANGRASFGQRIRIDGSFQRIECNCHYMEYVHMLMSSCIVAGPAGVGSWTSRPVYLCS